MGEELFYKENKSKGEGNERGISALCSEPLCLKELLGEVTDLNLNVKWSYTCQACNGKQSFG